MSAASKCTSTSDPMGDCWSDHSSLVTPPRFCDAENSSLRPIVSWANFRASSSLPAKTGNAPMNVAMSVPPLLDGARSLRLLGNDCAPVLVECWSYRATTVNSSPNARSTCRLRVPYRQGHVPVGGPPPLHDAQGSQVRVLYGPRCDFARHRRHPRELSASW